MLTSIGYFFTVYIRQCKAKMKILFLFLNLHMCREGMHNTKETLYPPLCS